jgi:hypothetical protein
VAVFRQSPLNIKRGLIATCLSALAGAAGCVVVAAGIYVYRWVTSGPTGTDVQGDFQYLKTYLHYPVVGCAVVFAFAGWATFAPIRPHRFARTLLLVFLISVPCWIVLSALQITPPRLKSIQHPLYYPSEILVLIGPPLMAAAVLTVRRLREPTPPAEITTLGPEQATAPLSNSEFRIRKGD